MDVPKSLNVRTLGYPLLLVVLCFLLFFWKLGDIPFYSRGEPREGLVVSEMSSSGNWILPLVNADYIPFKPPLFHWSGILVAKVLGRVDEFSVRFPSALFATLGVFLTYLAGAIAACLSAWIIVAAGNTALTVIVIVNAIALLTYRSYRRNTEIQVPQPDYYGANGRDNSERFRSAFDNAAIGMALVTPEGR